MWAVIVWFLFVVMILTNGQIGHDKDAWVEGVKVYVINLDRMPERMQKMTDLLGANGVPFERISATNGYNVLLVSQSTGQKILGQEMKDHDIAPDRDVVYNVYCGGEIEEKPDYQYTWPASEGYDQSRLTAGEFGNFCSHYLLMKKIAQDPESGFAVVFEDDIHGLAPDFKEKIERIKNIKDLADIIHLDPHFWQTRHSGTHEHATYKCYGGDGSDLCEVDHITHANGLHGYFLTRAGASKLVDTLKMTYESTDSIISTHVRNKKIRMQGYFGSLVKMSDDFVSSSITEMGRAPTDL